MEIIRIDRHFIFNPTGLIMGRCNIIPIWVKFILTVTYSNESYGVYAYILCRKIECLNGVRCILVGKVLVKCQLDNMAPRRIFCQSARELVYLYIHIPKGVQTLDGDTAMKVVRFRSGYASQDIGRMQTQQAFLKAAAKQTLTPANLGKVDDFVKIFQSYVETDLTLGNLAWLGKEAISMGSDAISFSTLPCEWKSPYIYLNQDETLSLINQYLNPYVEDRVPEDLNIPS